MQRTFVLREVPVSEYDTFSKQIGIPYIHDHEARGKLYCAIVNNTTTFQDLDELVEEMSDAVQVPRCVWFPGDCRLGDARRHTAFDPSYLAGIPGKGQKYGQLVIDLTRPVNLNQKDREDRFKFYREGKVWVLRYARFRRLNFGLYRFEGLSTDMSALNSISAIKPRRC